MGRRRKNMKTDEKQSCKLDVGRVFQQKAGGNFYYRYQIDGMRKCVSLDTQDLDEAIKYVKTKLMPVVMATDVDVVAAHVAMAKKMQNQAQRLFLSDAWETYSTHPNRANPATKAEQQSYEATFRAFVKVINDPNITIDEIGFEHAEKFAQYLINRQLAVDTHNRRLRQLKTIFTVLKEYRTGENPFTSHTLWRKEREERNLGVRRLCFSMEQEDQIFKELDNPKRTVLNKQELKLVFLLARFTAQRLKDCALLRWNRINMETERIEIIQWKTGKEVSFPIAPKLLKGLKEALAWKEDNNSYVCPQVATRYNTVDKNGKNIGAGLVDLDVLRVIRWIGVETSVKVEGRKKAVNQYGFHSFRHSFVSFCVQKGIPRSVVQSIVGDDCEIIDKYYTHVGEDAQKQAIAAVSGELEQPSRQSIAEQTIVEITQYIDSLPEDQVTEDVARIREIIATNQRDANKLQA